MRVRYVALPMLAVLIGLGAWQLQRLGWKTDLLAAIEARGRAPVAELQSLAGDWAAAEFRRVRVVGTIEGNLHLRLMSRVRAGKAGVHIVSPVRLDGGSLVLIDRGWAPAEWVAPQYVTAPRVDIFGVVGAFRSKPWLRPANDRTQNEWYWADRAAMEDALALGPVLPVLVSVLPTEGAGQLPPIPEAANLDLANNHLQYALTWFALAIGLVVIYMLILRRQ